MFLKKLNIFLIPLLAATIFAVDEVDSNLKNKTFADYIVKSFDFIKEREKTDYIPDELPEYLFTQDTKDIAGHFAQFFAQKIEFLEKLLEVLPRFMPVLKNIISTLPDGEAINQTEFIDQLKTHWQQIDFQLAFQLATQLDDPLSIGVFLLAQGGLRGILIKLFPQNSDFAEFFYRALCDKQFAPELINMLQKQLENLGKVLKNNNDFIKNLNFTNSLKNVLAASSAEYKNSEQKDVISYADRVVDEFNKVDEEGLRDKEALLTQVAIQWVGAKKENYDAEDKDKIDKYDDHYVELDEKYPCLKCLVEDLKSKERAVSYENILRYYQNILPAGDIEGVPAPAADPLAPDEDKLKKAKFSLSKKAWFGVGAVVAGIVTGIYFMRAHIPTVIDYLKPLPKIKTKFSVIEKTTKPQKGKEE